MRVSAGYVSSLQKYVIPSDFARLDAKYPLPYFLILEYAKLLFLYCSIKKAPQFKNWSA